MSASPPSIRSRLAAPLEERIALMAPSRRLRLALAREIIAEFAGSRPIRLLDAGAGDGLLSLDLAKRHPDWTVVGVDTRGELLEGARRRARARHLANVRFVQADLTQALGENGFDVVMALECLSEIPDDERALRTMAEATVPGGLLVLQVPERDWEPVLRGSARVWRHEVRHGYEAGELTTILRRAGFESVEVRPTYRALAAAAQEVRDRIRHSSLAGRAAAFPALAAAAGLERRGVTVGRARALLATAHRQQRSRGPADPG
jgi:trans-aconitate methyltransferase